MKTRCWVCGKFTSHDDYCPEHGKEFPDCKHFECPMGHPELNVCYPNTPHSCRRARKEGECLGYEKSKRKKLHNIVNTQTGEIVASGNTGMEIMENFSKTDTYKRIFRGQ